MSSSRSETRSRASVAHIFRTIMWPRKYLLLFGLFLILINRLSGLILPGASKFLIDDVIGEGNVELFKLILVVVGAAICVQAATSFTLTRLLSVEAHHLIAQLRVKIQKHVLRLPVGYFDENQSGALVTRVMADVEGVRNLVGTGLVQLIGGLLTAVVALVILMSINATMTVLSLIPLVLFAIVSMWAFSTIRPIFRRRNEINAEVTGRLTETIGGIRVIKGFNAEKREEEVFADGADQLYQNVKKTLTTSSLVTALATFLMGVASVTIMGYGGSEIMAGEMTVGEFFSFTMYLAFLVAPIVQIASVGTQITEAIAGIDRMEEILGMGREVDDERRTETLDRTRIDIKFQDVSFAYVEGSDVLRNIDLHAPPGSVTALVGSSGSGKTTIAGLAASFLNPGQGRVTVNGTDLSTVQLGSYRSQLGVVLQDEFLFDGTVRENILFSNPDASDEELTAAVELSHVQEFVSRFDEGLETLIGERGVKLSGGQRQRVSIARALIAAPSVLILDEATSNLDTESEKYIQDSLAVLMKGRTTFVIAHRLSTIRQADQILVVEAGEIVERGTHDELIEKQGRYHQLYTYQARI